MGEWGMGNGNAGRDRSEGAKEKRRRWVGESMENGGGPKGRYNFFFEMESCRMTEEPAICRMTEEPAVFRSCRSWSCKCQGYIEKKNAE